MTAINIEKLLHEMRLQIRSDNNIIAVEQEERITTNINKNIDDKFEHVQREIEELKLTNEKQEKRLALVEKQIRVRNLIFFGVEEGEKSYEDLEKKLVSIINNMGIKCDKANLEMVRRMGKMIDGKIRPINTTLTTYGMKLSILKNKKNLENTGIYIKEDFPPQVLETRRLLQDQVQKERDEGRIAYIRYDKIVIKEPNPTKRDVSSKKRELEITPPHNDVKTPKNSSDSLPKYQKAKKNKISKENQSSMISFVQKSKDLQASGSSSTSTITTEKTNQ